jgi:hypothetical protein
MPRTGFHKDHEGKKIPMSLKLPESLAKKIELEAKKRGISESALIRESLEKKLDEPQPPQSVDRPNIIAKIDFDDIEISAKMTATVVDADIPEPEDFARKLIACNTSKEIGAVVFGKASQGGWECYGRDVDSAEGWEIDDAIHFRNTLILMMEHPEMF